MSNRTKIGSGYLNFNSIERRMDRYGTVRLYDTGNNEIPILFVTRDLEGFEGKQGRLIAKIENPRKCLHVGDEIRNIRPPQEPLPAGEEVVLGEGELFFEQLGGDLHEKGQLEREDEAMTEAILSEIERGFASMGAKVIKSGKPEFGVVFKVWDDDGQYLLLMKYQENGLPDPDVCSVEDEDFHNLWVDMPKDQAHVVRVDGTRLHGLATVNVSHDEDTDPSLYKWMQEFPEEFLKFLSQVYRGVVVPHQSGAEEPEPEYHQVGLRPNDDRQKDWLDPAAIFQVVQQDVTLYFEPTE